jgi:hypothetical protein
VSSGEKLKSGYEALAWPRMDYVGQIEFTL